MVSLAMINLGQCIKKQRHHFADKYPSSQSYDFPSSHVWMWELVYKECWGPKNSCFWIVVLEKTLESPLDCKEIKTVNPKGNQPWILIGRTNAEADAPVLWPPDAKSQLIGQGPDAGKDWKWKLICSVLEPNKPPHLCNCDKVHTRTSIDSGLYFYVFQ